MVASAIAAGIGLFAASKSASAAKKAAQIQASSASDATAESRRQYDQSLAESRRIFDESFAENRRQFDQSRADMLPWLEAGKTALADLQRELGSEFKESEGYKFAVKEGEKGALSNLAALGMTNSGSALKRLTEFREGLASKEYDTWYNRKAGLAGAGQTQSGNLASLGQNFANSNSSLGQNYSSLTSSLGQNFANANAANQNFLGATKASGVVGAANAWNQGFEGVGQALGYMRPANQNFLGSSPFNTRRMLSGAGGLY